ncbi:transposase (plasmid) [Halobaculum magnesiiphilum]|uniref:Transposase n=1 Tax=Halobaculum magnesiiphilum TaxID=1017351 RepID=A0A8T8WHK8_9EURY|nr:transposase [Halobaculum magnesiiphilum]
MFDYDTIHRTARLARNHAFASFKSGRAENASYEDCCFLELQSYMGMVGCGSTQGARRFQTRRGRHYGPHGDTHLRAVKQFTRETLVDSFDDATERILSATSSQTSFPRPVTVAIDITTLPYYGAVNQMPMVSGTEDPTKNAYKFATIALVGRNIPLVLGVEPVRESSNWDENPPNRMHRIVRTLVRRAQRHVEIDTVLCDREFDSKAVYQTLSNLGVKYLVPKHRFVDEYDAIEQIEESGSEVAVESATIHADQGSHAMRFLYVPSTKGEGTSVFATNHRIEPEDAELFCRRYSARWQIENAYKSIKHDFLAKTCSKDYVVRLFYFVFAVLLYNIWRLTNLLLQGSVEAAVGQKPVVTAGECVELVSSALIPPD